MKPTVVLAEAMLPNRQKLSLRRHDGHYHIRVGGELLMSTTATASEAQMAELAHAAFGAGAGQRVLIGGFGFGFTLRRMLELVGPDVHVQVAELLPQIVEWNRVHLASVNGQLLDDPRVEVLLGDVFAVLGSAAPASYDAVLLDVDNGPEALVDARNERLYADVGLAALSRALKPGGRAVFWSAGTDDRFLRRLKRAGFQAEALWAKAYPQAQVKTHTLFVADWPRRERPHSPE
ncbi:MAG: spermine synthase [Planctomycetes bacterium]|nr:spermine synthase [Planctomycetota bacterium]